MNVFDGDYGMLHTAISWLIQLRVISFVISKRWTEITWHNSTFIGLSFLTLVFVIRNQKRAWVSWMILAPVIFRTGTGEQLPYWIQRSELGCHISIVTLRLDPFYCVFSYTAVLAMISWPPQRERFYRAVTVRHYLFYLIAPRRYRL